MLNRNSKVKKIEKKVKKVNELLSELPVSIPKGARFACHITVVSEETGAILAILELEEFVGIGKNKNDYE